MKQLLSPKQVAASVGVSESSLKRWCDQGLIPIERTPGGHRRIHLRDAIHFVRSRGSRVVEPEKLGLPSGIGTSPTAPEEGVAMLSEALNSGDKQGATRLVFDCYLAGASISTICDKLLTPALHQLGRDWQCGELEVYRERRACELIGQVLYDLEGVAPQPTSKAPIAVGGTPHDDHYRVATYMVSLALTEVGWNATSLGTCLPFDTLLAAVAEQQPTIFWLSLSHCEDESKLVEQIANVAEQLPAKTEFVLGGQALPARIDEQVKRVVICQDMNGLQQFARSLVSEAASEITGSSEITG